MPRRLPFARIFRLATSFGLAAAAVVLLAGPAQAVTCPTVDPSTGAVTPPPGVGVQWQGCDLSGANLAHTNMSSSSLAGANLTGANLTGTMLDSADLTNANLTNANLGQAMLPGTALAGATLTGVASGGISGTPSSVPAGWSFISGYLVGPGANLRNASLGVDLTGLDLSGADLTDAHLASATLSGTNLTDATLTGVSSGKIAGTPASLPQNWTLQAGYLIGPGADLSFATVENADLSGRTLTGINFYSAALDGDNFTGANLSGANLNYTNLSGANLSNSNLDNAILTNASLSGAALVGATLAGVQSGGTSGPPASLPANWLLVGGYLIGPGADLHGDSLNSFALSAADLAGADLHGTSLISANLTGAKLVSANLTGASLNSANLTSANAYQANLTSANLNSANLTSANLARVNLTGAGLSGSTLTGASLGGATLTGASGNYIVGSPASLPANWSVRGGYLIGPGAGTLLTDANLANLNLVGVDFSGLNLLRANLEHANLTSANLTKTNLTGVDFSYANLTSANLTGATVSSTIFTGTIWNNTTCPDGSNSNTHANGWCFAPPPSSGFTVHLLPLHASAVVNTFTPLAISCWSATECYGGGSYEDSSFRYLPALIRLTSGQPWFAWGGPLPGDASSAPHTAAAVASMSCPSATRCLGGGSYPNGAGNQGMLVSWSGNSWTASKAPLPAGAAPNPDASVAGMSCPSVTLCFAVGQFSTAGGSQYGLILKRSGSTWTAGAAPVPVGAKRVASLSAVACPSATLCFAGGWQLDASAHSQPLLLAWSAGKWAVVKVPLPTGAAADPQAAIAGLSCASLTQCVAVGTYVDSLGGHQAMVLTRSGASWTAAKAPLPAGAGSDPWADLKAVSCQGTSHCTAVGGYQNTASQSVGLLLFWSGKAWKAVTAPPGTSMIYGISCPSLTFCAAVSSGAGNAEALTGP